MEIILNDTNFEEEVLKADVPVLVDFWAPWCGPCKMIAPVVEEIARDYDGKVKVAKLNVDEAPQTASEYQIMSIPTLAIFKSGKIVDTIVGAVAKNIIQQKIDAQI